MRFQQNCVFLHETPRVCRFTAATAIRRSCEHETHKQDGVEIRARGPQSLLRQRNIAMKTTATSAECSQLHERLPPRCSYCSWRRALPMRSEFPLACVLIALRTRRLHVTHTKQRKRRASTPLIAFPPIRTRNIYCKPLHNRTDVAT